MSTIYRYKLSVLFCLSVCLLLSTFLWTNIPTQGVKSSDPYSVSYRFGYFSRNDGNVREWIEQTEEISFFTAPHRLLQSSAGMLPSQVYPVFDGSTTEADFNQAYSQLPGDMLPGYGKSVYSIDYGNARFIFLNAGRLSDAEDRQLEWLRQTVEQNKQTYTFVWMGENPNQPEWWNELKSIGIHAVFVGDAIYTPDSVIKQQPSEYIPAEYEGWGIWNLSALMETPFITVIEAVDNTLVIKAEDNEGKVLDQLEQDTRNLGQQPTTIERTLIGIQSMWRYHPGDSNIKVSIPEGFDVTGEHPITSRFQLPPDDWRSPEYDDFSWETGRAPLGHSNESFLHQLIRTQLSVNKNSPTYYFRKSFEFDGDPDKLTGLILYAAYEDGFVVYLNGQEVARDGIRTGLLTHSALAEPNEFSFYQSFDLKGHTDKLVKGMNSIAVEMHRSHPAAPQLIFDLSLSGEFE
ncbi:hypothetical protein [Cohnella sp.]|uniref:hypothetical protein n=1 Tax=Cohnella sp. TaxID=1883426 RepID=UPI003567A2C5